MDSESRIAVVGVVVEDRTNAAKKVNEILSIHADIIVGRLGVPYMEKNAGGVIALIINGTTDEIGSLTGKLGNVKGVKVKSAITA